jgi:transcriptional regulator with XRE-family HTH domain
MTPPDGTSAPQTLGHVLASARERADLSARELARKAGISHSQVSRIESGKVMKPSRSHLVDIARALDRNPLPLLIISGYYSREEAQQALRPLFRSEAELPQVWGDWAIYDLEETEEILRNPEASDDDVLQLAADVFHVEESQETEWDDSYQLAAATGENAMELQELMSIWRYLDTALRKRWLEYGVKLRDIADLEYWAEVDELRNRLASLERELEKVAEHVEVPRK